MLRRLRIWKWRISSWLMRFAQKPYAKTTLFLHSFADSSFFPVTIDITLIPISIAAPKKAFIFALWATIGSVLGGIFAYYIGHEFMASFGKAIVALFDSEETWEIMLNTFRGEYAKWTLIVASLTPLPFALATMASGVADMDFTTFLLLSFVGRATRFFLLALLINYFGPAVQVFLNKYSRIIAVSFAIIFILFVVFLIIR
ncbi:MAG: DedA family protein [Candidatus Kapabacteria bacterium]|nr:DedA family protein [Ignavibacteriota bacterium]MCW5883979.1 DedA family protein [Candidatus Kapabacteria bacterium]